VTVAVILVVKVGLHLYFREEKRGKGKRVVSSFQLELENQRVGDSFRLEPEN
jgi:hypothetical protein